MHGYPSGAQSSAQSAAPVVEPEAPIVTSSISTQSRTSGNVVASATVPFKAPAKRAAPVESEVCRSPLLPLSMLTLPFLAGRSRG